MDDLRDLTAAILVGGLGTRLMPVVQDRPKALALIAGRPFLAYLLDHLVRAGLKRAVLCTGHMGEQVQETFGASYGPLSLVYSQEPTPLGTAGALRLALAHLESDPVLALNGDCFCESDLGAFWNWHHQRDSAASILLAQVPEATPFGSVSLDGQGCVTAFQEKGRSGPGWINAGAYFLSRRLLESILPTGAVSIEREVFPAWIGRGLYGYAGGGRFLDIGTPQSYSRAAAFLSPGPTLSDPRKEPS